MAILLQILGYVVVFVVGLAVGMGLGAASVVYSQGESVAERIGFTYAYWKWVMLGNLMVLYARILPWIVQAFRQLENTFHTWDWCILALGLRLIRKRASRVLKIGVKRVMTMGEELAI